VDVVDLRADGESADETDYATCQMCGNEKIRYVHVMAHPDLERSLRSRVRLRREDERRLRGAETA
jgi:hypothetical protein